jgi:hypothetical protein
VSFPVVDAERAAVVWPRERGGRVAWTLPDDLVTDLATALRFEVRTYAMTIERVGDGHETVTDFTLTRQRGRDRRSSDDSVRS